MTAREQLDAALLELAHHGRRPNCSDTPAGQDHPWFSPHPDERAEAARRCHGCPLLAPCRAAGNEETWGVWGGIDRTKKPTKKKQPKKESKS